MLKCKEVTQLADQYIAGELPFYRKLSFKMHLLLCKHCNRYVHQLSLLVGKLKDTPQPLHQQISDEEIEQVYQKVKRAKQTKNPQEATNE